MSAGAAATAPAPELSRRRRTALALALALSMGAGPVSLYAVAALSPLIAGELGLTTARLGGLAAVMYGTAAVTALGTGRLVDSWPSQRVLAVLFGCSLLALAGVAAAPGYGTLLAAIVLCGAVQSASNPVTNKLIALHVPPGRRGMIVGVKQSGIQMAQFFAGAVLPAAALLVGWRPAVAFGLVPIALGWVLAARVVPSGRTVRAAAAAHRPRAQTPVALWQLAAYSFCNAALVAAVNVHVPLYAFSEVGLPAALAGGASGLIGGLGILARISWGHGAERRQTFRGPLLLLATLSLVAVALLQAAAATSALVLVAGLVLFAASAVPGQAVAMLALVSSTDRKRTGATTGLMMLALYCGFMAGPFTFGLLVDSSGRYTSGWLLLLAVAAASTAALVHPLRRPAPAVPGSTPAPRSGHDASPGS